MSSIHDWVRRKDNNDHERILKLQSLLSDVFFPDAEDDSLQERIVLSEEIIEFDDDVTTGDPEQSTTDTVDMEDDGVYRKEIPETVSSYPLVHTTSNTLDFPRSNLKYQGGVDGQGSGYITITDHANLTSDTLTIAFWIRPKASSGTGIIVRKNNEYEITIEDTNVIRFRTYSGGAWRTGVTYTYTSDIDTWICIIAQYDNASGHTLYKSTTSQDSDSDTGSITGTANDMKILGDGTSDLVTGTKISWLVITNSVENSAWRTNYATGELIDFSTDTEITTIPFVGDESPQPVSTSGLCRST